MIIKRATEQPCCHRFAPSALLLVGSLVVIASNPLCADQVDPQREPYRHLVAPMNSVVEGKPFRGALRGIAESAGLNIWIDRRVDPTASIHAGQVGPNVYAAIKKIAEQRGCVVMPIANVVLVGRQDWVDGTADALLNNPIKSKKIDVHWNDLTTPSEALTLVSKTNPIKAQLPHDLWPQTDWKQIEANVATTLVLAQFDKRLEPRTKTAIDFDRTSSTCRREYHAGKHAALVRQIITREGGKVRADRDILKVVASAEAHRLATDALLQRIAAEAPANAADEARFTLNLKERAGAAINTFAIRAGRKCMINPEAQRDAEQIVTLQAQNKTLQELSEMVARQAGLKVAWGDKQVIVYKSQKDQ